MTPLGPRTELQIQHTEVSFGALVKAPIRGKFGILQWEIGISLSLSVTATHQTLYLAVTAYQTIHVKGS